MPVDHQQVWNNCLNYISSKVTAQSFSTWFKPIKPIKLENASLTIQVPNKFFYEWLEEHFIGLLKETITKELGESGRLEYQIPVDKQKKKPISEAKAATQTRNPFAAPGVIDIKVDSQLNPKYLFEAFIEGDCNRMARAAGMAIAKDPGGTAFNPLFAYGQVGLGKTHLAHAIGNEVKKQHPKLKVLFVSADKFTHQFIESIKNKETNDFVMFYRMIDVLIIDDIQFLENRVETQRVFFTVFNELHQHGKQIILTADRPPKELKNITDRLISRFKWGLTADLQAPDLESRMAILKKKMERQSIKVEPDILEYISFNITNNIRELEGIFISLVAQSSLNRQEIDMPLAKSVIRNFITEINKEISIEFIQELVAEHYNISVEKIVGKTRKQPFAGARQLCMYLAKNLTKQSLKTIGESFSGRDHSTVIYSCKSIQDMLDTDEDFRNTVAEVEKKIKMSINA